ncbi:MAG: hypothetical protein JKY33_01775, partial [Bacteroidia bacterium]|nr:hypothetical protein [Bacteroidia bacterium]
MSKYYKYISYFTAIAIVSYVLAFVIPTIISRLFVPLSVEHQEGVHATMIWMWNKGVNLYSYPSKEFSSWIYTPGFYVIGKLWTDIFGLSIPVLRGLSLLSMFITALFSGFMIFKITQSKWISSLWLFLYLTLFHLYGWIDNANKESLHI